MKGRAGRKGRDILGESIVFCTPKDLDRVRTLVKAELKPVFSCLTSERKGMKRALLEVIRNGIVSVSSDVDKYVESTLLYFQSGSTDNQLDEVIVKTMTDSIKFLVNGQFIEADKGIYRPTKLGIATVSSSLSPEEALIVFEELQRALKGFVLEDELHIVYQVTPTFLYIQPNWSVYLRLYNNLTAIKRKIADSVGVSEWYCKINVDIFLTRPPSPIFSLPLHVY